MTLNAREKLVVRAQRPEELVVLRRSATPPNSSAKNI